MSAFGSQPAFGSGFGQQSSSAFGGFQQTSQSGLFGQSYSAFGQSQPAFGAPSGGFGVQQQSQPFGGGFGGGGGAGFGTFGQQQSSQSLFGGGQSAFGGGQTGGSVFGQPQSQSAFGMGGGGGFGASSSPFGGNAGGFGGQSPGGSVFGQTQSSFGGGFGANTGSPFKTGVIGSGAPAFASNLPAQPGTRAVPFKSSSQSEGQSPQTQCEFQHISAMPQYQSKSPEELRWEDYSQGVRGATPGQGGMFGGVGSSGSQASVFGGGMSQQSSQMFGGGFGASSAPAFGSFRSQQSSASAFGGGGFGQSSSSLFGGGGGGFGQSSQSLFGAASSQSIFGGFGAGQSSTSFGSPMVNKGNAFGAQSSPFGAPSSGGGLFGGGGGGGGGFGSTFGSQQSSQSLFGGAQSSQASLFGAQSSPFGGSPFGGAKPPAFGSSPAFGSAPGFGATGGAFGVGPSTGGGLFGGGGLGQSSGGLFGNTGGGLFGSGASTGGGLFGGGNTGGLGTFGGGGGLGGTPAAGGGLFGGQYGGQQAAAQGQQVIITQPPPQVGKDLYGTIPNPATIAEYAVGLSSLPVDTPAQSTSKFASGQRPSRPLRTAPREYTSIYPSEHLITRVGAVHGIARGVVGAVGGARSLFSTAGDTRDVYNVKKSFPWKVRDDGKTLQVGLDGGGAGMEVGSGGARREANGVWDVRVGERRGDGEDVGGPSGGGVAGSVTSPSLRVRQTNGAPGMDAPIARQLDYSPSPRLSPPHLQQTTRTAPTRATQPRAPSCTEGGTSGAPARDGDGPEALPTLNRPDYYCRPSIVQLQGIAREDPQELKRISNFMVIHKKYGQVQWEGELDVSGLDLDSLVNINEREIVVFPDPSTRHTQGTGLNRPAIITMYNVFETDKVTGQPVPQTDDAVLQMRKRLQKTAAKQGAQFLDYKADGTWMFRVKHFSRYAVDVEEVQAPREHHQQCSEIDSVLERGGEQVLSAQQQTIDTLQQNRLQSVD